MLYFLDTEFNERPGLLELISLGLVCEDGRELYAEVPWNPDNSNEWVRRHVWPHLANPPQRVSGSDTTASWRLPGPNTDRKVVAANILDLVGPDPKPRFFTYYGAYDWVAFCWLFGRMVDLPERFPMFCWDLKQMLDQFDLRVPAEIQGEDVHNALHDARANKRMYEWLLTQVPLEERRRFLIVP